MYFLWQKYHIFVFVAELLRERNNFSTFGIPVYFCEKSLVTGSDWQCPGPVGSGWIHIDLFIWCQSLSRRRLFFHRSRNWFKSNRLRNTGGGWLGLCEGASNVVGCGGWCFKFIRLFAILKVLLTIMVGIRYGVPWIFFIPVQYIVRFRNKVILFYIYECLYRYGTLCVKWFPYAVLCGTLQARFFLLPAPAPTAPTSIKKYL